MLLSLHNRAISVALAVGQQCAEDGREVGLYRPYFTGFKRV